MRIVFIGLAALLAAAGCSRPEPGTPLGSTYARIGRPAVWRVTPRSQAESLGIQSGDVIVSYNNILVENNDELTRAMIGVDSATASVPLVVLRGDEEIRLNVRPGPLGIVPDAGRYPASLALALEDILNHFGVIAEYDWLAALTSESFAFTANPDVCRSWWVNALAGEYLDALEQQYGLEFQTLYAFGLGDSTADSARTGLVELIRGELERGRIVLIHGGWPDEADPYWGVVVRYEDDDSLFYGYTAGLADEQPVTGDIMEAYVVRRTANDLPEPEAMLRAALVQALEMGQAYSDSGWQSGLAAYDVWIGALDSVPFCPECGEQSQACFDKLVIDLIANKESANRFLADMRDALPDEAELLAEAIGYNTAIISKLNGIELSRVRVGTRESQEKLARVVADIQLLESQLLMLYEEIVAGL